MTGRCLSGCFTFYIGLSLLTHVAELVTNVLLAYFLYGSPAVQGNWFSLVTGILLIPLVLVQLLSTILLLNRRSESMTTWETVTMAALHVVQLGFIWRHFNVVRQRDVLAKKAEMAELFLLRMTYAFASGFPLLLVHAYLILNGIVLELTWALYAAAIATLLSTTWSLGSFRRQHETCDVENIVLTWPGSVFRLMWRAGEISARVFSLSLFATYFSHWLFLVIGLHWITMLVCVCTAVFNAASESNNSTFYKVSFRVLVAYMYIFAFINFSHQNAMFRYVMYYVIMFLENLTLCMIWMLQDETSASGYRYMILFITATCFFVAVVSMTLYYKFFHISVSDVPSEAKSLVCVQRMGCINCKLSVCVKHKLKLQRPFSAGWYSQYSDAVYNGHYYKNLLHDSLIDSAASDFDAKSVRSGFYKPGTISEESNTSFIREVDHLDLEKRSVVSFQSAGTYSHKRYMSAAVGDIFLDEDLCSESSSVPASLISPRRDDDQILSESSLSCGTSSRWIASPGRSASQTCLLTDTWDSISQLNSDPEHDQYPNLPSYRSLLRDDHHWYSDGYTTDNTTLEWSKLPVTDLGANRILSDSESECYCHCEKAGGRLHASSARRTHNKKLGTGSESGSAKEAYMNWSRKCATSQKPAISTKRQQRARPVSAKALSRLEEHNDRVPAWVLDTTDKLVSQNFEQWSTTIGAVNSTRPHSTLEAPFFDIDKERSRKEKVDNSSSDAYHSMAGQSDNSHGRYVKGRRKSHHNVGRHHSRMTDSDSENRTSGKSRRSRSAGPSLEMSSRKSDSDEYVKKSNYSKDAQKGVQKHEQNRRPTSLQPLQPRTKTHPELHLDQRAVSVPVLADQIVGTGVRNIRATSRNRCKSSVDSGVGSPDVDNNNDDYVMMTSGRRRSRAENVYENRAYIGDNDEVFVGGAAPRLATETPWYVCSESEDSALPQETLSSGNRSNCGVTVSDHESDDSLELII